MRRETREIARSLCHMRTREKAVFGVIKFR